MANSIVDYILEEDYARYNELLSIAETNKENAPKVRKERQPLTPEQKLKAAQSRRDKAQAKLDALLAAEQKADEVQEEVLEDELEEEDDE